MMDFVLSRIDDAAGIDRLFNQVWPGCARDIQDILDGLKQHGAPPILFNLPLHCDHEKLPNDLDLLFSPEAFTRAVQFLTGERFVSLTYTPAKHQRLMVGRLSNGRFIRFHLHSDLWFSGVRLARYETIRPYVRQMNGMGVPKPELDYLLLLLQWHFRRKQNYSDRIKQISSHCDRTEIDRVEGSLEKAAQGLIPRLEANHKRGLMLSLSAIGWPYWKESVRRWVHRIGLLVRLKRRGGLVYLMGIDGTGKTTLAERMVASHDSGLFARYVYLGLKITLVQKVRGLLLRQDERERYDGQSGVADRLAKRSGLLSNLFNLCLSLVYIVEYILRVNVALRHVRKGNNLLVIDRGYYDKLTEPHKWGNKLFFYLLPRPDLIIGLKGDPGSLYERKREFEPEVLVKMQKRMDLAWKFLEARGERVITLDSTEMSLNDCLFHANSEVWDRLFRDQTG